ncbi:unnamed protein product [Urochloa decumbens]|uniref:WH1 domain-containing protein n=1 Tax=Urochloa decumbens TaxID=240449 RepID=A0ABC9ESP7_9POAL
MAPSKLRFISESAFKMESVSLTRDVKCYLGLQEGPQSCLVAARFIYNDHPNRWMSTVRVLQCLVGNEVTDYRVAIDPARSLSYILCPDSDVADAFRGHYVSIGYANVVFEQVMNVTVKPFGDDVDQHTMARRFI